MSGVVNILWILKQDARDMDTRIEVVGVQSIWYTVLNAEDFVVVLALCDWTKNT